MDREVETVRKKEKARPFKSSIASTLKEKLGTFQTAFSLILTKGVDSLNFKKLSKALIRRGL